MQTVITDSALSITSQCEEDNFWMPDYQVTTEDAQKGQLGK